MGKKNTHDPKELSAEILHQIVVCASNAAIDRYEKEGKRKHQEAVDRRLHNTELLLRNYRSFKFHSEKAVFDASNIKDDLSLQGLLEMMGCIKGDSNLTVLSVQESAARTSTLVHHIDNMLDYFKFRCENSGRPEDERRWRIIRDRYVVPEDEQKSFQEIADEESLSVSAVYKDHKEAIRKLSALMFGYVE